MKSNIKASKGYVGIYEPFYTQLLSEEWKRAKKILFQLRNQTMPLFFWADWRRLDGAYGRCNTRQRRIFLHVNYRELGQHEEVLKEFRDTIRHEIIHLIIPKHNQEFKELCQYLDCHRFVTKDGEFETLLGVAKQ